MLAASLPNARVCVFVIVAAQVAVLAYNYMLAKSLDDDSSYSSSFFAREIVSGPDAVVRGAGGRECCCDEQQW